METISDSLNTIEIFKAATCEQMQSISSHSSIRKYPTEKLILSLGDKPNYVYFVLHGTLQVYLNNTEGKQVVLKDLQEKDCFGELGVLCNTDRCANVITTSEVLLLMIYGNAYLSYCNSNLEAAKITIRKLSSSLTKLTKDYQSLALDNLGNRLVKTLIELSDRIEGNLVVSDTHGQIAQRVAATRESVSRAISKLHQKGLLNTINNKIVLDNKILDLYSQL